MRATTRLYTALVATLVPTVHALAATGTREDTSGIYVWAFLGFCALIVAAQVIPAVIVALSGVKGVVEGLRERHRAHAQVRA